MRLTAHPQSPRRLNSSNAVPCTSILLAGALRDYRDGPSGPSVFSKHREFTTFATFRIPERQRLTQYWGAVPGQFPNLRDLVAAKHGFRESPRVAMDLSLWHESGNPQSHDSRLGSVRSSEGYKTKCRLPPIRHAERRTISRWGHGNLFA